MRVAGGRVARGADAGARFERSARFWMRAYPRRWRAVRGEELLGVLRDLAAPGARSVGLRAAVDLLRGGWSTRLRQRPPFWRWVLYRNFNTRVPPADRAWVRDDIEGFWYPARNTIGAVALLIALRLFLHVGEWTFIMLFTAMATVASLSSGEGMRRKALLAQLAPRPGETLYSGQLIVQDAPRRRTSATDLLGRLAAGSALVVVAAGAALCVAPLGVWLRPEVAGFEVGTGAVVDRAGALVPLGVGALLAVAAWLLVARRLRAYLVAPVEQPFRKITPMTSRGRARLAIWLVLLCGAMGAEMAGLVVPLVSPWAAPVAAALLTGSLAARRVLLRTGRDVAAIDVWSVVGLGRRPALDAPIPDLVPLMGPVLPDAVVPPRRLGAPPHTLAA